MDRRTALLTTLLGAFAPPALMGQEGGRRDGKSKPRQDSGFRPAGATAAEARAEAEAQPARDADLDPEAQPPAGFVNETGFQWRRFPISRYTQVAHEQKSPQKALIDWIFRRTGTSDWHGDKTAVLSASKSELRAYNSPEVLDQVKDVVERFVDAEEDFLRLHIQVVAAVDTRWRYTSYRMLQPVGGGPQGQQIWTLRMDDAATILGGLNQQQGFRRLVDQSVEVVNGQTLTVRTFEPRTFSGGIERSSASGTGYQAKADKIEESIVLRLSPLLAYEGTSVDAAVELTVNSVQAFQRTKIMAPSAVGPNEMSIDVPVAYQTRIDQTLKSWALGQTLLLSGGIHPGVIDKKGGWLGTPLGAPSSTEVLVFLDIDVASRARGRDSKAEIARNPADEPVDRGRSRAVGPASEGDYEEEAPPARTRKPAGRAVRGPDLEPEEL